MAAVRRADAAITGLGLLTPAGIGVDANWDRLRSGRSCAVTDENLKGLPTDFSCRVEGFDPVELGSLEWQLERFAQLAVAAARAATEDAGWDAGAWDGTRVGVVLGNSLGGGETLVEQQRRLDHGGAGRVSPLTIPRFMVNMAAGYVAIDRNARGPSLVTAAACASGTMAVGLGRHLLQSGQCDVVLAGGSESALTRITLAGLAKMNALAGRREDPADASRPFDAERDGFVPAEAAGILVLEREEDARARGARIRAVVRGYGASTDAYHATAQDPEGRGIERALRAALADADLSTDSVDHVNAHGTSTPMNDVIEGTMLRRVLGARPAVTSTKGVTGHALAAAGAVEAAYTALALERGEVPPTANLEKLDPRLDIDVVSGAARSARLEVAVSTSLGFGGHNAALVLTAA